MSTKDDSPISTRMCSMASAAASGQFQPNGVVFPPLFYDKSPLPIHGYGSLAADEDSSELEYPDSPTQSRLYDSCVRQKQQDMINQHTLCLTHLREVTKQAEALRRENAHLKTANQELNRHLSLLIQDSGRNQFHGSSDHGYPFDVINGFRSLVIGDKNGNEGCTNWNEPEMSSESPTSVIENNVPTERTSLPKSISVRSNGYLKTGQVQGQADGSSNGARGKGASRPRTTSPVNVTRKVYVRGGKKEEEPLEMVVYNQGMIKTELCNKWQETGTCPYGEHCQFAHGIEELRPVIRHPRYKTEVCRMILAGVVCPYGHRCHFRHALTDEEKAITQHTTTLSFKLDR